MRLNLNSVMLCFVVSIGAFLLTGCSKDNEIGSPGGITIEQRDFSTSTSVGTLLTGLTPRNELIILAVGPPVSEQGVIPITGLRDREIILAIDTRPATMELFGVSNQSRLYVIDPSSGMATAVSNDPFTPAIAGSMVAFDFNPMDDQIRLMTEMGQNMRINPTTAAVVGIDISLDPFTASLNSIAYSYPTSGSRSNLYDMDPRTGDLYWQTNPNGGARVRIGATGFMFSGEGGFEITRSNAAFSVQLGKSRGTPGFGTSLPTPSMYDDPTEEAYRLLHLDLRSGAATSYGKVRELIGLAMR